jgi:TonB family protein
MTKRILYLLLLTSACSAGLRAQAIYLISAPDGKVLPVAAVAGFTPEVMENGKLVGTQPSARRVFKKAASYADGYVKFNDFRVDALYDQNGIALDGTFSIAGSAVSDLSLKNCYLLFVFEPDQTSPSVSLEAELPDLVAGNPASFKLTVPKDPTLKPLERNYHVYFFSGSREHVTSLMSETEQRAAAENTDAEILARTENRKPSALLMMRPRKLPGSTEEPIGTAMIRCRIGYDGLVSEAAVVKASTPAFGQSAVIAVKQWIFTPAIKEHRYVETTVDVPVTIEPPKPAAAAAH